MRCQKLNKKRHLILFDDRCGLCRASIAKVQKLDRSMILYFAPLWGETAKKAVPQDLLEKNSFVLVENYEGGKPHIWIYAKALFRLFWLLGGWVKPLGLLHFLPGLIIDPLYRLIARSRGLFRCKASITPDRRFLP